MNKIYNEIVSVDDALKKGWRMVNIPCYIIILFVNGFSLYLTIQKILPIYFNIIGFILSFLFSWLYWSIVITKWRLWAFENVSNVNELYERAIREKIISPKNSFFEKTEIRNKTEKLKWNNLQEKFKIQDKFTDDLSIPNETIIYYSKFSLYTEIIIGIAMVLFGIYSLITKNYLGAIIFIPFGIYMIYKERNKIGNRNPQIIINKIGIEIYPKKISNWSSIKNIKVVYEESDDTKEFYLSYNTDNDKIYKKIDDLTTNSTELEKLIGVYKNRNKYNYR